MRDSELLGCCPTAPEHDGRSNLFMIMSQAEDVSDVRTGKWSVILYTADDPTLRENEHIFNCMRCNVLSM